jgi:hypothetical protein
MMMNAQRAVGMVDWREFYIFFECTLYNANTLRYGQLAIAPPSFDDNDANVIAVIF